MDLELEREEHQMTDKQKEAIEYFKKRIDICMENANICDDNDFDEEATCLRKEQILTETVVNLIQTQQTEIEKKDNKLKDIENHIKAELRMIDKCFNEVGWAGKEQYDGMRAAYKCLLNIYFENQAKM